MWTHQKWPRFNVGEQIFPASPILHYPETGHWHHEGLHSCKSQNIFNDIDPAQD